MGQASDIKAPDRLEALIQKYGVLERLHRLLDQGQAELEQAIGWPICTENCGRCCKVNTPVVLDTEVHHIFSTIAFLPSAREKLVERSLDWLTHKHPGLSCYGKITGIPKTDKDKKLLAYEVSFLSSKQCPYLESSTRCLIYASRPLVCHRYGVTCPSDGWCPRPLHWTEAPDKRMIIGKDTELGHEIDRLSKELCRNGIIGHYVGFLPAAVARELAPDRFKQVVSEGRVADAKVAVGRPMLDLFRYESPLC